MIQNWNSKDYKFKDKIIPNKFLFKRGPWNIRNKEKGSKIVLE
jgi:hypothetical protein